MRGARVLLYLSPLILFLPPLLPAWNESVAWGLIGFFFGRVLRAFPWNLAMAGLSYVYARQVGREEWRWSVGSFALPFLTPLILAIMPPRPGSVAATFSKSSLVPAPAKGVTGSFEERFPLLERCLSTQPEAIRSEQTARYTALPANFEFALTVAPGALERVLAEAQLRKLAVWVSAGPNGTQLYGAGLVASDSMEETTGWLRGARASGTRVDVASRDAGGRLQLIEYHPA